MNELIEWTVKAFKIGILAGTFYGLIFGFKATLDWGLKEGVCWFFGIQILSPIFMGILIFIMMGVSKLIGLW